MAGGDTPDTSLSLNTTLHLLTIKLSSTNYLLWRNQVLPLLAYQKLTGYIDGSISPPSPTVQTNASSATNPAYISWNECDQRALIILQASLSEEAMSEVLGFKTAREVWCDLETAYSHDSVERMNTLRDSLRQLQKGSTSVSEYGRKFKALCDQLSAIGHPVDDIDKTHWFLCCLGPFFENFSTTQQVVRPRPVFHDLLFQAKSHEIFLNSLHGSTTPPVAFVATQDPHSSNSTRGGRGFSRGGFSNGRGRGRRPPHCQLCHKDGHYASQCPDLASFANQAPTIDANLAQPFHAQCHVPNNSPD